MKIQKKITTIILIILIISIIQLSLSATSTRMIPYGTTLDPQTQIAASRQLAKSIANPSSAQWQAKGDQKRTYKFPDANNVSVAYRVCVPSSWDGKSKLPLVMFLHGAGNDESSYLDQNNKQMVNLALQHGFVLVSPLGYQGSYGTFLRLPAVFGLQAEADKLVAARTSETERTNELSEKDVINVLEIVKNEYPIDSTEMFLTGHSMGSGGTWYIGGKYSSYWKALAPMSGPFVMENGFPWDSLRRMPVFVTEGSVGCASTDGSRTLRDWMKKQGFKLKYKEVAADHPGMVPLVLPDVFNFFDSCKIITIPVYGKHAAQPEKQISNFAVKYLLPNAIEFTIPEINACSKATLSIFDLEGKVCCTFQIVSGQHAVTLKSGILAAGTYMAQLSSDLHSQTTSFAVLP